MPTQHNSPIHEGSETRMDAAVISILRKAGALIFGKLCRCRCLCRILQIATDVHLLSYTSGKTATAQFAAIDTGPATRNPHDPSRTPGGSSSGSGAAVADMHVPIALGTQTGGSIIRPASFNGIYALKPTWGAISTEGQKVVSGIFDTIGFFARSVEDLQLMADVFQFRDDDVSRPIEIAHSHFGILKTVQWKYAQPGTVESLKMAAQLLESQCASVDEITLPSDFDDLHLWHRQIMSTDLAVTHYSNYCTDKNKLPEAIIGHVENRKGYTHSAKLNAMDNIARLRPLMDDILSKCTAVLTPSAPGEAPTGENTGSPVFNTFWTVGKRIPLSYPLADRIFCRPFILLSSIYRDLAANKACLSDCLLSHRGTGINTS